MHSELYEVVQWCTSIVAVKLFILSVYYVLIIFMFLQLIQTSAYWVHQ